MLSYSIFNKNVNFYIFFNISDCKWISSEEFETYRTLKKFIEINGYEEADIKPIDALLIIHSDDLKAKSRYEHQPDVANNIGVSRQTLMYVYENERLLVTGRKGEVKWLED